MSNKPITKEEIDVYMANYEKNQTKENTGKDFDPIVAERIRSFAEEDDGNPFFMVNLIKERKELKYPDNWTGPRASSIIEAKKMYSAACLPFLHEMGSESVFGVTFPSPAVLNETENPEDWDQFYLVKYQSKKVFLELISSEFYSKAIVHKNACDENTVLIPAEIGKVIDYKNHKLFEGQGKALSREEIESYLNKIEENLRSDRQTLERFRVFAEQDDGKPFFMINLVKQRETLVYPLHWSGPRATTIDESKKLYTQGCQPIKHLTGGLVMVLGVSSTSEAVFNNSDYEEDFDQFYVVGYGSRREFLELLSNEVYAKAFVHKKAGDKYTVLIPVAIPG